MADYYEKSEVREGMRIDWDVPVDMDDGLVLRANVYRPVKDGRYPIIMSYGPYGKDLAFQDLYSTAWEIMVKNHPDVGRNSTNIHQSWEVVDPEKWVPDGYVCVRVDSRGAGRSPGFLEHFNRRETRDFHDCIEWAAKQAWSNGKVGLNGISYYATNQWQVAAIQPPHLAAICVWEGQADFYREASHHGGIYSDFIGNWYDLQIMPIQHGYGERGYRSRANGQLAAGPITLPDAELKKNRIDLRADFGKHALDDTFYAERTPDLSKVKVPLLSCANWGGQPLHPRGNYRGFNESASRNKWLEVHGLEHWSLFYTDYGIGLQKRFFDRFLKGARNDWSDQPKVHLNVRHPGEKFVPRGENEWPLKRTKWTKYYLDPAGHGLSTKRGRASATLSYQATGDGLTFMSAPLEQETEITGPMAAKLWVSSSTSDADLFVVVRIFAPDFREVTFRGALDPHTPFAQGWLRASHRKLDKKKSKPYRPYHPHDGKEPLKLGEVYELDVEIHPAGVVVPKGHRIAFTVRGRDYVFPGVSGSRLSTTKNAFTGVGPFIHEVPDDRPPSVFANTVTLHFDGARRPYVLLPVIPPKSRTGNLA